MSFKFIHASDLHLDTPFEGLKILDPKISEMLKDASLTAWDRLIDLAITDEVDFILLAGDIYDGKSRGVRARSRLLNGLRRLSEQGIKVFIVQGNHDPVDEGGLVPKDQRLTDVYIFPPRTPERVAFSTKDGDNVEVHGISFGTRSETEDLSAFLERPSHNWFSIALLHASVGGDPNHEPYSPTTATKLGSLGFDYYALGHIHTRQVVSTDPYIVYCGNSQGLSPKPSELGLKGCYEVQVDKDQQVTPAFVQLGPVVFDHLRVDIDDSNSLSEIADATSSRAERLIVSKYLDTETVAVILRVTLVGHHLGTRVDEDSLIEELNDHLSDARSEIPIFVTSIRFEHPVEDVESHYTATAAAGSLASLRISEPQLENRLIYECLEELIDTPFAPVGAYARELLSDNLKFSELVQEVQLHVKALIQEQFQVNGQAKPI